jgi:O-antigen/teichoic acid export membrane protein
MLLGTTSETYQRFQSPEERGTCVSGMSWLRLRKLLLFAAAPIFGIVSPLLVIPAITTEFGARGWAAIAIGLSAGAAGSVLIELGWGLTGPQQVARLTERDRGHVYLLSLLTKLVILLPVAPLIFFISSAISVNFGFEAGLMGVAAACFGLSPGWFFTGTSQPLRILVTDSIPKLVAAVISAVAILNGASLIVYPSLFLVSALLAPLLGSLMSQIGTHSAAGLSVNLIVATMRRQSLALTGRAASSLYLALPTTLLAVISPGSVASFAAADRLQRMALAILAVFPSVLQNWIGSSPTPSDRVSRVNQSVIANAALGALAGLAFALLAPILAGFVFSEAVPVSFSISSICGLIIFITCTSRATGGLGLVAVNRVGWLTISAVTGAGLGVPLILTLGRVAGTQGALIAMVVAEGVVLLIQSVALYRGSRPAT